jgi:hypothetical protein
MQPFLTRPPLAPKWRLKPLRQNWMALAIDDLPHRTGPLAREVSLGWRKQEKVRPLGIGQVASMA